MKIKNVLSALLAAVVFASSAYAVEVNKQEIESVSEDAVVFENYVGPHSVINTAEEIAAIGTGLGQTIAKSVETPATAGFAAKYQIIHAVDPNEKGKLDADIFIIGPNATVDHIKNVRRIIAAYLVAAYGYSDTDSKTLATFVTVYNAVYRGKLDYYQSKYKKVVTDNLTSDKAGIALSYKEWPGKTQLIIPLNDLNGGLSTVDTSVISDKKVVESMQEDDDKNVNTRKEMVDIKEREADNAQKKAETVQKKATEESNKLKEQQKKTAEAKKEADTAKKEAETAQKKAEENPDDKQAQKEAEDKKAVAEQKQEEADTQAKATEEQAKATEEARNEAADAQATADTKRTEAQNERQTIAEDQQKIIKEQTANENAATVYGLKAVDELGVLSSLVKMNADNGKVIKESPVTVIRSRSIYEAGETFVAIAGTNVGNGAVKLVLLDNENMEIIKESAETVAENSVLVQDGSDYYCVIKEGDKWVVGKFNANLEPLLKSPVSVKPATPITITSKGVMVTSTNNRPILLNAQDLTLITDSDSSNAK